MRRIFTAAVGICVLVMATGCNLLDKRVVFATKTQLGLDVSGTAQVPDKVSLTYGRFEGAIVPRSENGEPYSVYGGLDADVNFWGKQTIKQIFSTGEAAIIAADQNKTSIPDPDTCHCEKETKVERKALFFVTDTAYGLKLSAGKQDISPTMMVGFKRVEGAIIPVHKTEAQVRSVFADLSINTKERTENTEGNQIAFPNNNGVRIVQGFATGRAAEIRATDRNVKEALAKISSREATVKSQDIMKRKGESINAIMAHITRDGKVDKEKFLNLAKGNRVMEKKVNEATATNEPSEVKKRLEGFQEEQIYWLKNKIPNP